MVWGSFLDIHVQWRAESLGPLCPAATKLSTFPLRTAIVAAMQLNTYTHPPLQSSSSLALVCSTGVGVVVFCLFVFLFILC